MDKEESIQILKIIDQIENNLKNIPDYEEISIIHDHLLLIQSKIDRILEHLEII